METKRGRGRPAKSPDEKRAALIQIRVTDDELLELEGAAPGKLSAWAREVLLRAARRRKK
jgi:hypothetical protein